jgi:hypothetical protein
VIDAGLWIKRVLLVVFACWLLWAVVWPALSDPGVPCDTEDRWGVCHDA